jgi:hypothetical protein
MTTTKVLFSRLTLCGELADAKTDGPLTQELYAGMFVSAAGSAKHVVLT